MVTIDRASSVIEAQGGSGDRPGSTPMVPPSLAELDRLAAALQARARNQRRLCAELFDD
jgi:hypothetical protein